MFGRVGLCIYFHQLLGEVSLMTAGLETITQKICVHLIADSSCLRFCFEGHWEFKCDSFCLELSETHGMKDVGVQPIKDKGITPIDNIGEAGSGQCHHVHW
uniref:Uncharacterized protein n=1 Tax=Peromyscus maniculatus bairdii TaxID=230844 RepID=A0A8C8UMG5_PERMB